MITQTASPHFFGEWLLRVSCVHLWFDNYGYTKMDFRPYNYSELNVSIDLWLHNI